MGMVWKNTNLTLLGCPSIFQMVRNMTLQKKNIFTNLGAKTFFWLFFLLSGALKKNTLFFPYRKTSKTKKKKRQTEPKKWEAYIEQPEKEVERDSHLQRQRWIFFPPAVGGASKLKGFRDG